jgi:predicted O-methyltransferase YrrM
MRMIKHKLYQFWEYIQFLARSTNQHGVHSPFVYHLVTQGIYRTDESVLTPLFVFRKQLLQNRDRIDVGHYGAGSKTNTDSQRSISDLVKNVGITPGKARLLYKLINYRQPQTILELGTSLGLSSACIALAAPQAKIVTVDGSTEVIKLAKEHWHQLHLKNIEAVQQNFNQFIQVDTMERYDCILFDGDHSRDATLQYFHQLLPTCHSESMWILDDIHWSKGMSEAWSEIKRHSAVSVTIDFFYYGVVFFKHELSKENFVIRGK